MIIDCLEATLYLDGRSTCKDRGFVLDSMAKGCRTFFLNSDETNRKIFNEANNPHEEVYTVLIFSRRATDEDVKNVLDFEYDLEDEMISSIIRFNELSCEQFLNKYANHVSEWDENEIRRKIISRFADTFKNETKEVLIERLVGFLNIMSTESLARMYEEKFLTKSISK